MNLFEYAVYKNMVIFFKPKCIQKKLVIFAVTYVSLLK